MSELQEGPVGQTLKRLMALVEAQRLSEAEAEAQAALATFEAPDQRIAVMAILSQIQQHLGDVQAARATALEASAVADRAGRPEEARALRELADAVQLANPQAALDFQPLAQRMMDAMAAGDARTALQVAETLMPIADAVGPTAVIAVCIGGATAALALGVRPTARVFLDRGEATARAPSDLRSLGRLRGVLQGPDAGLAEFAGNYALKHDNLDDAVAVLEPALPLAEPAEAVTLHRMLAVAHFRAQRVADALEHSAKAYHHARQVGDDDAARAMAAQVQALQARLSEHVSSRPKLPPPAHSVAVGIERILTVLRAGDMNHAHALAEQAVTDTPPEDPVRVPLLSLAARLRKMAGDLAGARAAVAEALNLAQAQGGGAVVDTLAAQAEVLFATDS
ncbi:MAG: hypothetical protein H6702_22490 [Myxococcales bacterium]|nr:hypothetical protein [Myxococcales bacterium]